MNMIKDMLGGLIDREKETFDTIQSALEDVATELQCPFTDFFIMIKPIDGEYTPRLDIFHYVNGKPTFVRQITLKEILNIQDENT